MRGGGTCGLCKCRVLSGGGSILSTETEFFTRREQQSQWRLGCWVEGQEDMEIEIPEQILGVKMGVQWSATGTLPRSSRNL